ncbi:hypothetical protein [Pedobacter cryophilus]|nr:hypothetical protein [Pedobacter cryophilus]
MKRLVVYPADIKLLTGKSDKAVYKECHRIREKFGLGKKDKLTTIHVKDFYHITLEELEMYLIIPNREDNLVQVAK